jgi:dolichol-phosphate mannosyltransferase
MDPLLYIRPDIKLTILLPVRNEGANVRIMVRMLMASLEVPSEVLVVYDSADDDTVPVVTALHQQYANVIGIHNTLGRGIVNAIRAGVQAASGRYILVFAADEVGPVVAIEDMLALMEQGCELVSCTRYAYGGRRLGGSIIGGILSRMSNWLFRKTTGCALTDLTTGIKMFERSVFDRLHLEAKPVGWAVAFEMAMKAQLAGLKLGEVPIVSVDRLYGGESTFRLGPWVWEYFRWFYWGVLEMRKSPRKRGKTSAVVRVPAATAK